MQSIYNHFKVQALRNELQVLVSYGSFSKIFCSSRFFSARHEGAMKKLGPNGINKLTDLTNFENFRMIKNLPKQTKFLKSSKKIANRNLPIEGNYSAFFYIFLKMAASVKILTNQPKVAKTLHTLQRTLTSLKKLFSL